jgi:hypothetical protein
MLKKFLLAVLVIFIIIGGGVLIYLSLDQYSATLSKDYQLLEDSGTLYKLDDSNVGFIFYQGGKVEADSYSYLVDVNANVFILDTPFNLAIFNFNKAQQIVDKYPQISRWYVGGHSLGGSSAFLYAASSATLIEGIIYLGSYPTQVNQFKQLAIFGSEDGLLDYNAYLDYFDEDDSVKIIAGGNHAQFGEYGIQADDGTATISGSIQRQLVIDYINEFIGGNK